MSSGAGVVRFIRGAAGADGSPDAELVRRFAASADEQAFRTLVARHGPVVWAVCRRMLRNHHDAEDAFQATFLVLARGAGGIRTEAAVGGWLCGVAAQVAGRVRSIDRPQSCDVEPTVGHPDGALGDLTVREAEAVLYEELARLPERYRAALVLCCLEGLSRDEVAAQLGWTENRVKSCLERGRELLRSRLGRRGVTLGLPLLTGMLAPPAFAAGPLTETVVRHATGTAPPAAITALANGVTRTMWIANWKWVAVGCAAVALTAGGILVAGHSAPPADPAAKPVAVPVAVPVQPAKPPAAMERPKEPLDVAAAYLQHIIDGKPEQALKLASDRVKERHTKEIQASGLKRVKFALVLMNNARVQVITERAKLVRRPNAEAEDAHVVVEMERERVGAPWMVVDSDVTDEGKILREIDHYLSGDYNFKKPAPPLARTEPDPPPRKGKDRTPRDVATQFLTLVLAEKDADAVKLTVPGTVSENKVGEIRKAGFTGTNVVATLLNDTRVEVVSEERREEKGELRHLVLMLTKSKDGLWQVKDIDARDEDAVETRVKLYLEGRYNDEK